jgi:hypothetical protein
VKLQPLAGLAVIDTVDPLALHPLAGLTLPPVPWLIVKYYCVLKFAVYVLLVVGATI